MKEKVITKPKSQPTETESEYDNSNSGALFKNTKKRAGKKDPDLKGSFTDSEGNEYWLSAWVGMHKKYGQYFSIKASPKEEQETEKEEEDLFS